MRRVETAVCGAAEYFLPDTTSPEAYVVSIVQNKVENAVTAPIPGASELLTGLRVSLLMTRVLNVSNTEAKELNSAIVAQNRDYAILRMAHILQPDNVSGRYLLERRAEVTAGSKNPKFVMDSLAESIALGSGPDQVAAREAIMKSFNRGLETAYLQGINSRDALNKALADPQFKERYTTDPAFRQGIRAAVDQATRDPEKYKQNVEAAKKAAEAAKQLEYERFRASLQP